MADHEGARVTMIVSVTERTHQMLSEMAARKGKTIDEVISDVLEFSRKVLDAPPGSREQSG